VIQGGLIGLAGGSSGGSITPLVATSTGTFNIPAGDTADYTILTIPLTLTSTAFTLVMGSLNFKFSVANAGLHVSFQLDGVQIGPPGGVGNDMLVHQTTESEQFTFAFFEQIPAGSHSLTFHVAVALAAGAAAIQWYQLSAVPF